MQSIPMQIERLEKTVDGLYNRIESMLGTSDVLTIQALQVLVYLQGLKYDVASQKEQAEKKKETD